MRARPAGRTGSGRNPDRCTVSRSRSWRSAAAHPFFEVAHVRRGAVLIGFRPADVDHDAAPVGRTRARVTGCTSGAPGVIDQSIDAETAQIQETMLPALLEFVAAAADEPAQPTEPGRLEWDA